MDDCYTTVASIYTKASANATAAKSGDMAASLKSRLKEMLK
jgi:hypothetical protein